MVRVFAVCAVLLVASCSSDGPEISAQLPPPASTWPAYPRFSAHSCWTRRVDYGLDRHAPSVEPQRHARPVPPARIVRRLLARFGDRTFIKSVKVGRPPLPKKDHVQMPKNAWPKDALWAYIRVPNGSWGAGAKTPRGLADWEANVIWGGLRDDFCAAGGPPLIGWSLSGQAMGLSDGYYAFNQRFPNPSSQAFRTRVAAVGKRYGFDVRSIQLLRPRQLAPVVSVETERDRKAFVRDVAKIKALLAPASITKAGVATTFEAFFFEARDRNGLFVRVQSMGRGTSGGGRWADAGGVYPYLHG